MKKKLSLLIALLNEEENIPELYRRISELSLNKDDIDLEFIFIDDGSSDNSWMEISSLAKKDPRVRGLRLSKNFGNHRALLAGLSYSSGDVAMNLAADLQNPPELLNPFIEQWESGSPIVLGFRKRRNASIGVKIAGFLAYMIIKLLGHREIISGIPSTGVDIFLIDKKVINEILQRYSGKNASIIDLILSLGFGYNYIEYDSPKRETGKSKWTLIKKIKLLSDCMFYFSYRPISFLFIVGIVSIVSGFLFVPVAISLVNSNIFMLIINLFIGGLILVGLGIIGEYLRRIHDALNGIPAFIVKEKTFD
jgi:polyisoprenyl-phosphate glycosyltransferase